MSPTRMCVLCKIPSTDTFETLRERPALVVCKKCNGKLQLLHRRTGRKPKNPDEIKKVVCAQCNGSGIQNGAGMHQSDCYRCRRTGHEYAFKSPLEMLADQAE